jgi:hypothetical protein
MGKVMLLQMLWRENSASEIMKKENNSKMDFEPEIDVKDSSDYCKTLIYWKYQ